MWVVGLWFYLPSNWGQMYENDSYLAKNESLKTICLGNHLRNLMFCLKFLYWGMASIANCSTPTSSGSSLPTTLTSFIRRFLRISPKLTKKTAEAENDSCFGCTRFVFVGKDEDLDDVVYMLSRSMECGWWISTITYCLFQSWLQRPCDVSVVM